ncbi:DUF4145 domain-containing protein [Myxococcus xanthus]|uniref:DUF4145 domain-containing protein n=1 Tax=Myxococcus xanthus TaxID=34 RepID=UPI001375CBC7|nr:DUF4145 domain-containing protein [Myxococcus xanthus]
MNKTKNCWNSCTSCSNNTDHEILEEVINGPDDPSDYPEYDYYQIVKCKGCHKVSFRKETQDYVNYDYDEHGGVNPTITIETYPRILKDHRGIRRLHPVPQSVRDIYTETINATKENALTLAGIGFRAVIEAICNDQQIKGKDLKTRIANLAKNGMISNMEANRLHAIRFLGNDAAHDIKCPRSESIRVVLQIVEHLIENIYILDSELSGTLETVISDYSEFRAILTLSLKDHQSGAEHPLSNFLGKAVRRLVDTFQNMEKQLISEISSGNFTELQIGKNVPIGNKNHPTQHFIKK